MRLADVPLVAAAIWIGCLAAMVRRGRPSALGPILMLDAVRHYPDGIQAHLDRAMRAGERGDAESAAASLRLAREKGYDQFMALDLIGAFEPIRRHPAFLAAKSDLAALWLSRHQKRSDPNQAELRVAAMAHLARGEREEALRALERARAGGRRRTSTAARAFARSATR
jgi:hypothetical protein